MGSSGKPKSNYRSAHETVTLHLLLHIGFSKSVISKMKLRRSGECFSLRAVERAIDQLEDQPVFRKEKWTTTPKSKNPCKLIKTSKMLIDFSLFGGCLYYLYDQEKIENLSISDILKVFDLYTNLKQETGEVQLLSPDSAFWLCQEFANKTATMRRCHNCKSIYLKSCEQRVFYGCPFCR